MEMEITMMKEEFEQMFNDGEIRDENNNIVGRFVED